MMPPLLKVEGLSKHFPIKGGLFGGNRGKVSAVTNVSLEIAEGETLGLVGESGCGKSTLGRTILRLYEPTAGRILFEGADITTMPSAAMRQMRRNMQIIFQDPYASLNPRMNVETLISEPLRIHRMGTRTEIRDRVASLVQSVGLNSDSLRRFPHEFSGGQRQRIGIARALALGPKLIVADEPVSALDVSIQSQILNLLVDLRSHHRLTYLFISHDLAVIQHISTKIAVMYLGQIVEYTDRSLLYSNPRHPYTQALLAAIPRMTSRLGGPKAKAIQGDVPSPVQPPSGCAFHPRCPLATDRCRRENPMLRNLGTATAPQQVACHNV